MDESTDATFVEADMPGADALCPLCGMPIELMQFFEREEQDGTATEYATVRCLQDHYMTVPTHDMDLFIVQPE